MSVHRMLRGGRSRGPLLGLTVALSGCCQSAPPSPAGLVVFLHGTVPPGGEGEARAVAGRVIDALAGVAEVRAPEGRVGLCDWSDDVRAARCWPSDARKLADGRDLVSAWGLEARRPTVIVGFSNGAAFAALASTAGLVDVCGAAALHGAPAGATPFVGAPRPLLLVTGNAAPWEANEASAFEARAHAAGLAPERVAHAGAHAVSDDDLATLRTFVRDTLARCATLP